MGQRITVKIDRNEAKKYVDGLLLLRQRYLNRIQKLDKHLAKMSVRYDLSMDLGENVAIDDDRPIYYVEETRRFGYGL